MIALLNLESGVREKIQAVNREGRPVSARLQSY